MTTTRKTPITYWGGKQNMVAKLLPLIPSHTLYCEPFAGGAALFWSKMPSEIEVINDLNREVANFYQQIRENFLTLQHHIQNSLHSRDAYADALHIYARPSMFSPIQRAWAFWVVTNQGWGGCIGTWGYGVGDGKKEGSLANKRNAFDDFIFNRLAKVQIECNDAIRVIKSRDRETSFFYVDPPYFNSDMGHYDGYSLSDFEKLLNTLSEIKGKFLLSSYPSDILRNFTLRCKWYSKSFDMTLSSGSKGKRKVEVVTANFEI